MGNKRRGGDICVLLKLALGFGLLCSAESVFQSELLEFVTLLEVELVECRDTVISEFWFLVSH